MDLLIYIQSLQRYLAKPRCADCRRMNVVLKYLKATKVGIRYVPPDNGKPFKIAVISDAAFKAIPDDPAGLAIRDTAPC